MYEKHTLMYKFSYITGCTAHITATQCMLNLYSNVQKRHMYFACDVRSDAHYGQYANGCKIVHWRFSDGDMVNLGRYPILLFRGANQGWTACWPVQNRVGGTS